MKFRKKPVIVDAWLWDESLKTLNQIGCPYAAYDGHVDKPDICRNLKIRTLEGTMAVSPGDFIIKGIVGEFYPCKPHIFHATYEPVADRADCVSVKRETLRHWEQMVFGAVEGRRNLVIEIRALLGEEE